MKRVNAYIIIVFIGLSSLFIFLTKEAADTANNEQHTSEYNVPADEKPFVYTGIQQDKKTIHKKIKIKFKSKATNPQQTTESYELPQIKKITKSKEKKETETATVAATKSSDKDKPKLDKDGNPITEDEKNNNEEGSALVYNEDYKENYNYEESYGEENELPQNESSQVVFAAQQTFGNNNTAEDNNTEGAEQLTEWRAYLFESPSSEKFSELLNDFQQSKVDEPVFRNLISEAFQSEQTQEFAFEVLKQNKSSFSFNLLATSYDANNDDTINKEILTEINTYAALENVSHLKNSLQNSDSIIFETSLNVLKLSMDTHLGGRSISSTETGENANEIFASFLPIFSSLDRVFDEDDRLIIFDTIFSSLLALFSNDTPQELTV